MVPPAHGFLQVADGGPRHAVVRIDVTPGTNDAEPRDFESLEQPGNRVRITVGPAADGKHRTGDGAEVHTHGAMLPVVVETLVLEPQGRKKRQRLDTLEPTFAPGGTHDLRIERASLVGQHDVAPPEIVVQQATTHEVDVVGIAIVARTAGNDRLERRRPTRRHLQGGEAAPRDADHADRPVAPRLSGGPGDGRDRIVLFLRRVLIVERPVGITAAAQIDAQRRDAMLCEPPMEHGIADCRQIGLPVRDPFEDHRHLAERKPRRQP